MNLLSIISEQKRLQQIQYLALHHNKFEIHTVRWKRAPQAKAITSPAERCGAWGIKAL